jgi:hypothetical protein
MMRAMRALAPWILVLAAVAFVGTSVATSLGRILQTRAFMIESIAMIAAGAALETIAWGVESRYGTYSRILGVTAMVLGTTVAIAVSMGAIR